MRWTACWPKTSSPPSMCQRMTTPPWMAMPSMAASCRLLTPVRPLHRWCCAWSARPWPANPGTVPCRPARSEEHTSELQSPCNLVCRLLLEKKKHEVLKPNHEVVHTEIAVERLNVLQLDADRPRDHDLALGKAKSLPQHPYGPTSNRSFPPV